MGEKIFNEPNQEFHSRSIMHGLRNGSQAANGRITTAPLGSRRNEGTQPHARTTSMRWSGTFANWLDPRSCNQVPICFYWPLVSVVA
jgi:hypothetical protein